MDINNIVSFNNDIFDNDDNANIFDKIHIRMQQRNKKKCITTVEGLPTDLDLKKIIKYFKKQFQCNGNIKKEEDLGDIIQLSGDQRSNIYEFLTTQEICTKEQVVIHGN